MEINRTKSFGNSSTCNGDIRETVVDKFMQYSADQVMVLEQFFVNCQKPSHTTRLAMIRENSVLSNLDSQQIQAWFEDRRSIERKKMETFMIKFLDERMAATRKLMLLENKYLHGEVQKLLRENEYIRKLLHYASLESYLTLEVPRSVFKNVKMVAAWRLMLLRNEFLRNEVHELRRRNERIQNLLENVDGITSSDYVVNFYQSSSEAADNSNGLVLFPGTRTKFYPKTPSARDWVSIPRMKFFGGVKEISVSTCSDLTNFPLNGIIIDASVMLSFVKAAMLPDGPLDLLLCQHQEFVVCCSFKDIKLGQISFKDGEKSPTATVLAFLPLDIKLDQISLKEEEASLTAVVSTFLPKDIKLDKIAFKDREEALTAVLPALLPQRFHVVVGRYSVLGAWRYVPNEQAASGDVKFMLRFKFIN